MKWSGKSWKSLEREKWLDQKTLYENFEIKKWNALYSSFGGLSALLGHLVSLFFQQWSLDENNLTFFIIHF